MNHIKRSITSSKSAPRYSGKPKDIASKTSSSKYKTIETNFSPESNDSPAPVFPVVKQIDNSRLLPRYNSVLTRSNEDGVCMEDLDQLQQDLEKLLSTSAVRLRVIKSEIESIDQTEERRKTKRGKFYQQPLKRKRPDDRSKYRDARNGRILKNKHPFPINNFVNDLPIKREVPKVTFPKNDTSDKFWLSIEPYCRNVKERDVDFLDGLIQECAKTLDYKIPELGEHYSISWADELLGDEKALSGPRIMKNKNNHFNELKKNGLNAMVDTFSSPLTQRLLAALIEEKVVSKMPSVHDRLKATDFNIVRNNNGSRNGMCMDRRLRKELIEQGILDVDDIPKSTPPDDFFLTELKKCVDELKSVNKRNIFELSRLRTVVAKDIRRQEVSNALEKIDNEVMDMYNRVLIIKQKQSAQADEETYDKLVGPKNIIDEHEEDEANTIIQQQAILHGELAELSNATILT